MFFPGLLLLYFSPAHVAALHVPIATGEPTSRLSDLDISAPQVTEAPIIPFDLLRRNQVINETVLLAPDNTCGFHNGSSNAAYVCDSTTDTCAFFLPTSKEHGLIGCCNTANCRARTTCVDQSQYNNAAVCDDVCKNDVFTVKCTQSTAPYCNGATFPDLNIRDWFCHNSTTNIFYVVSTTYSLQLHDRSFSTLMVPMTTIIETTSLSSTLSSSFSSSSLSSPVPISSSSSKSIPIGPIVGGSVGGFIVLIAVVIGIYLWLRRRRRNDTKHNPQELEYNPAVPTEMSGEQQIAEKDQRENILCEIDSPPIVSELSGDSSHNIHN